MSLTTVMPKWNLAEPREKALDEMDEFELQLEIDQADLDVMCAEDNEARGWAYDLGPHERLSAALAERKSRGHQ